MPYNPTELDSIHTIVNWFIEEKASNNSSELCDISKQIWRHPQLMLWLANYCEIVELVYQVLFSSFEFRHTIQIKHTEAFHLLKSLPSFPQCQWQLKGEYGIISSLDSSLFSGGEWRQRSAA